MKRHENQPSETHIKKLDQENLDINLNSLKKPDIDEIVKRNEPEPPTIQKTTVYKKRVVAGNSEIDFLNNPNTQDNPSSLSKDDNSSSRITVSEKEDRSANENIKFIKHSKITAEVGATYFVLEGHDPRDGTTGRLLSGLSPKFFFAWKQNWSKKIDSRIFLGVQAINFEPEESGLLLKNSTITNSRFGVGFGLKLSTTLKAITELEINQALFYRGLASGGIEINQVPLVRLSSGLWWTVVEEEPFKVLLLGNISYWSPSSYGSYSIEPGISVNTGLRLEQNLNSSNIYCKVEYFEKRQNSSILNLNEKEAGFSCGLNWSVGL